MSTAFIRLTWKEYRANRAFWIGLVALTALAEMVIAALVTSADVRAKYLFIFALGAPAFFAAGSAGMAFAVEREEGTLEFLRAIPALARQVLLSKLAVAAIATVAMYGALWPLAVYFNGGHLPEAGLLSAVLGVWLVAALEAIAWGTFFSLLTDRPLLAICEAIFAVSLTINLLVPHTPDTFWKPGHAAVLVRMLLAAAVLVVDAYLGVRWMDRKAAPGWRELATRYRVRRAARITKRELVTAGNVEDILLRRGRGAMFGHLLWHHWRQSALSMFILVGIAIALVAAVGSGFGWDWRVVEGMFLTSLIGSMALMGCFVFQADQARHRYRFFVEHNVPPRYVWLSRQLPWLTAFAITTTAILAIRVGPQLIGEISSLFDGRYWWNVRFDRQFDIAVLIEAAQIITFAAISYAAGQWASMMIRSAVIAVVAGAAMAVVLCGWAWLARAMGLSALVTVVPIPLLLLVATWLRAPDWIAESPRRNARLRAAAILVVPTVALLVGVRLHRVRQVPLVAPGFNVAPALSEMESPSPAAEALRRATVAFDSRGKMPEEKWLAQNSKTLALLADAVRQPGLAFQNPLQADDPTPYAAKELFYLAVEDAARLQKQGKLDAAADQFFVALRLACKTEIIGQTFTSGELIGDGVFTPLVQWGAEKGQTTARIKSAIQRLRALGPDILPLEAKVEWYYLYARNKLQHGDGVLWSDDPSSGQSDQTAADIRWAKFMPWERQRAERMLNLLTASSVERLHEFRGWLAEGVGTVYGLKTEMWSDPEEDRLDFFFGRLEAQREAEWLRTTHPADLEQIGEIGMRAASTLVRYEAWRRSTMILLALEAYRIDHGGLPKSLDALVPVYLDRVLPDPYSGAPFDYFPTGIAADRLSNMAREDRQVAEVVPGTPGIWATGPDLVMDTAWDEKTKTNKFTGEPRFRVFDDFRFNRATVWQRGLWFPIPEQQH